MRNDLFERVCDDLKQLLQAEPFRSGARLPAERVLAERLGVNRSTVREVIRSFVNLGLLETRRGSGTTLRSEPSALLNAPIEAMLLVGSSPMEDLYEARELVEVYLAGQAALLRSHEDLVAIETALGEMRPPAEDFAGANDRFHAAVAKAGQNLILMRFLSSLSGGISSLVRVTQPGQKIPAVSFEAHEAIATAIREQDPGRAQAAMREHMRLARQGWSQTRGGSLTRG